MRKEKKNIIELVKEECVLVCTYTCPNTSKEVSVGVCNISAWNDSCECCGSHGSKDIELEKCPECGFLHTISWSSW